MKYLWRIAVVSSCALLAGVLAVAPAAASSPNGTQLSSIIATRADTQCASINAAGDHFSVGVGIAFDGTKLLISCYSDSKVTEVDEVTGAQLAPSHAIAGAGALGALSWDGTKLWGCSNFSDVGIVDLVANTFTFKFTSQGCFDGLAFDAAGDGGNGSMWASADASATTQQYKLDGTLIASNANGVPCGNSGLAAGTSLVYMGTDGCSSIYQANKAGFPAGLALFASFPRRIEDLECDPITFKAGGDGAIWSIDAYDNVLNAWAIPADQCPLGGGGGQVPTTNSLGLTAIGLALLLGLGSIVIWRRR